MHNQNMPRDGRLILVNPEVGGTQGVFEQLLAGYDGHEATLEGEPISDGVSQKLFVRSNRSNIPNMGAEITDEQSKATYYLTFFNGQPAAYGPIVVTENRFDVTGGGRGISTPSELAGGRGQELADQYDAAIVQAASNHFGVPILHSRQAQYGGPLMSSLQLKGYSARKSYPETMDRIFTSQK
jgi:hypothetical protein